MPSPTCCSATPIQGEPARHFPQRLADNPAYLNYPGENGHVLYGEGLFVGYGYCTQEGSSRCSPSATAYLYTRFDYANLCLSTTELSPDQSLSLSLNVTNMGERPARRWCRCMSAMSNPARSAPKRS